MAVDRDGPLVVARLSGEVDLTNAPRVGAELRGMVSNEAAGLVLDLESTRYLDSAAIGVLFDLARRLAGRRQELRLVVPRGSPLKRTLEVTELGAVAPMHETIGEALEVSGATG
jgi:anti-anti-sigma factor